MTRVISVHRLIALAIVTVAASACGFGDDRTHLADDAAGCGDGSIDPGEDCDDADTRDGDGCDADCQVEAGWSCAGEPSTCAMTTGGCGDGAISGGEDCDDAGTDAGDGCSSTCRVEAGWECSGSPSTCQPTCGNGHLDPGEECDGGPACDATCHDLEPAACTLVSPQTGCATGLACDLADASGATACRGITSNGTSNNHCAADTECAAGYTCVGDETQPATTECMRFCTTDAHCNGAGSRCLLQLTDGADHDIPGGTVCTNHCEPVAQAGCPTGQGCLAYADAGGDFTDCLVMGTRVDGQSCTQSSQCMPGSMCVDNGTTTTCHSACEVGEAGQCAGCVGFSSSIVIGTTEIGACP